MSGDDELRESIAKEYLELNRLWDNTDKVTIAENVRRYMSEKMPECDGSFNSIWDNLINITGAKQQTVYAWLNRSRSNVKVPLIHLCELAKLLNVDVMEFFKEVN